MSLDFYDANGQPYAYSDDGESIFTFSGVPIGYISGDSIYSYSGQHLGFLDGGMIWDHHGSVLLFSNEASGGPLKPLKQLKPLKSLKQLKPLKSLRAMRPLKPLRTQSWSNFSPIEIFKA